MPKGEVFWIIYLICFLFGAGWNVWGPVEGRWQWVGSYLPYMILIGLLGWQVFGPIIH